ncbi:SDR family oxidoreductase [Oceanobacillus jeddahense]|uniref:SDR family oxidoreductase n=1 Tax=Oceanobacillus jeddahense TaxID=1462527 RepID=UPI0005963167|nr:SDR family oxidoreductase [Oceanobacillus jeddahense]
MGIIDKFRLDGKKAFITGGAGGIGKAISKGLLEAGADVAIVDINLETAQAAAEELSTIGPKVIAVQADVTNEDAVNKMIETIVDEFGRIDIAFANAGITLNIPAEEMTFEEWNKVINLNLNAVFLTDQAAGKQMIKQGDGGTIINTGSMSGSIVNIPQPQSSYNASKAAVIHLSKSLAVEWADHNIRVNSISPGYIGTDLLYKNEKLKPLISEWEDATPQKRLGKPEELQAIALYLASDASSYATGSDFIVDGGYTTV